MAELINLKLPKTREVTVLSHSDTHVGSKTFHEEAYKVMLDRLADEKHTYATHGGDVAEGKRVDSPHFEPDTLHPDQLIAGEQYKHFRKLIEPVADKFLFIMPGNHDRYHNKTANLLRDIVCEPLGVKYGGYQTFVNMGNGIQAHYWHGFPSMPRGAKDPIQREANQRAWLKNRTELLASAHIHFIGHVHHLMYQEPLREQVLGWDENGNIRADTVQVPEMRVGKHGINYVPKESRHYACTGTFRRTGGFGYDDYSEVMGFPPSEIGYIEWKMKGGKITKIGKVVV